MLRKKRALSTKQGRDPRIPRPRVKITKPRDNISPDLLLKLGPPPMTMATMSLDETISTAGHPTAATNGATPGAMALFEKTLRRFKIAMHVITLLPLYLLGSLCIGISLAPGIALYTLVSGHAATMSPLVRYPAVGIAIACAYFIYGMMLILVVPAMNFLLQAYMTPWRGPYYSAQCLKWYIHNGLIYLVRYTFLEFITPTPFNLMFFRLMGMKLGEGCQINSSNISDASLIELGSNVTIGGSATIVGHYGMGGFLVMAPVKIGNGATIGLKATVMGGAEIGEKAKVMPNSVVLPRTKIPAGETWGGVPARKIDLRKGV